MDAQALLGKLLELREAVIAEKTRPEVAVLEARMAIRDTVTRLRPGVRMMSKAPAHLVGPNAELGQACMACMQMVEGLVALLREPDGSDGSMRHVQ